MAAIWFTSVSIIRGSILPSKNDTNSYHMLDIDGHIFSRWLLLIFIDGYSIFLGGVEMLVIDGHLVGGLDHFS